MHKNRKAFSLVELIVVLVIMAILVSALVPSLIGYIRQTRQSTAQTSASQIVNASQTVVSAAYADSDHTYYNTIDSGDNIIFQSGASFSGEIESNLDGSSAEFDKVVMALAEVDTGSVSDVTLSPEGVVDTLTYTSGDNIVVKYNAGVYTVE